MLVAIYQIHSMASQKSARYTFSHHSTSNIAHCISLNGTPKFKEINLCPESVAYTTLKKQFYQKQEVSFEFSVSCISSFTVFLKINFIASSEACISFT